MAWKMTCFCDQCGKAKGEANGWIIGAVDPNGFFCLRLWDIKFSEKPEIKHFCSSGCYQQALNAHLELQRKEGHAVRIEFENGPVGSDVEV